MLDYRYGSRDEWEIPNQGYYKKYNMNEILKPESLHGKELREKFLPLREGKIRCFFPGTWDLFHVGHLRQLQRASEIYDYVTVGIHSDESACGLTGYPKTCYCTPHPDCELFDLGVLVDGHCYTNPDCTDGPDVCPVLISPGDCCCWRDTEPDGWFEEQMENIQLKMIKL